MPYFDSTHAALDETDDQCCVTGPSWGSLSNQRSVARTAARRLIALVPYTPEKGSAFWLPSLDQWICCTLSLTHTHTHTHLRLSRYFSCIYLFLAWLRASAWTYKDLSLWVPFSTSISVTLLNTVSRLEHNKSYSQFGHYTVSTFLGVLALSTKHFQHFQHFQKHELCCASNCQCYVKCRSLWWLYLLDGLQWEALELGMQTLSVSVVSPVKNVQTCSLEPKESFPFHCWNCVVKGLKLSCIEQLN